MLWYIIFFILLIVSEGRIILFSDDIARSASSFSSAPATDALCASIKTATPTLAPVTCTYTIPLLTYSYRTINNLDIIYSFSDARDVVGPTGTYISAWNNVKNDLAISTSLSTAGVVQGPFWSGYSLQTCNDWTTNSAAVNGNLGAHNNVVLGWLTAYNALGSACSLIRRLVCICIDNDATVAPTTPTTASPKPTINPTLLPTKNPTKNPTLPTSPTSKAPTKKPTLPTLAPSKSPTVPQNLTFYSNNVYYSGNSFLSLANANSMCASIKTDYYPSLSCSGTAAFLDFELTDIKDLALYYGFSSSARAIGPPPSNTFIGLWSSLITGVLTNSFSSVGVFSVDTPFWTGTTSTGWNDANCFEWNSNDPGQDGKTGLSNLLTSDWKSYAYTPCDTALPFACFCIGGTSSPTEQPTQSPTKKPTTSPTKKPTDKPTISPTKNPTTASPTRNPTRSPTITEEFDEVVFMAPRGSSAQIQRIVGANASYSVIDGEVNAPVNVTLRPGVDLIPIKWSNVIYRLFDPATNTTSNQSIAECNPISNRVQGTTPMGNNGLRTCPTIRKCENCTVNLNPSGTTWSTLRACICTYTVTVREDIADLAALNTYTLQTIKLGVSVPNPVVVTDNAFIVGELQCNNFIDRELNCQFPRFVPNYPPQCESQPISCFNFTLGYAFGAFWNQNPKFRYDLPRANWTEAHYHGIATVLNNLTYSKNTFYVDPMLPSTFTDYYWFENITSLDIVSRPGVTSNYILVPEIAQGEPYIYEAGNFLQPDTTYTNPFTSIASCILYVQNGLTPSACDNKDWENLPSFVVRLPGYWELVLKADTEIIYSVDITPNFNFSGVEVYTPYGQLCGRYLAPTQGLTLSISCIGTVNNTEAVSGPLYIRYLGVSNFWDIPGAQLSSALPVAYDALVDWGVVSTLYSQQQFINLVFGISYAYYLAGLYSQPDLTLQFPHRNSDRGDYVLKPTYVVKYGVISDTDDELTAQRNALFSLILNNNTYPRNLPLEARVASQGYTTSPVNFSSPDDLDYLYRFWGTWLAPRRCSEDVECRTFNLGRCIFPQTGGAKQFWYNGDPDPDYDIPAGVREGGCLVYNSFEQGYYSPQFFGANCKEGYGPLTISQWQKILQYNTTISQTLPSTSPFNISNPSASEFESELACKFPVGKDPLTSPFVDLNMCGGHGEVAFATSSSQALIPLYSYKQYWLGFECYELLYNEEVYTVNTTQTIFALQYVSPTSNIITIITGSIYLNGEACTFFRTQSLPAYGILQCGAVRKTINCLNELYFTPESRSFSLGRLTQWEDWIVYFV